MAPELSNSRQVALGPTAYIHIPPREVAALLCDVNKEMCDAMPAHVRFVAGHCNMAPIAALCEAVEWPHWH